MTCPRCSLVVHSPPVGAPAGECPRCATALPGRPRTLPAGALGRHELGVHEERVGTVRVIELWGELTRRSAPVLADLLARVAAAGPCTVVLDLAPLNRLTRPVVPVLAAAAAQVRAAGGEVLAAAATPALRPLVQEALGATVHPTSDAAIAALPSTAAA